MQRNALSVFNKTLQKTHSWLREFERSMEWGDMHDAYRGMRSVLHALRDRLTPEQAVRFGAQLPMLVRGFYYENWKPGAFREGRDDFAGLLADVAREFPSYDENELIGIVESVFEVLGRHVSEGEMEIIFDALPEEIRLLWPRRQVLSLILL